MRSSNDSAEPGGSLRSTLTLIALALFAAAPLMPAAAGTAAAPEGRGNGGGQGLPETPHNLKVLPADMTTRQVVTVMRGFANALGVRCVHCHVGDDGADLSNVDFASDERGAKRKARVMMRMVEAINDEHLSQLDAIDAQPADRIQVGCVTCHHGQPRPLTLQQVLLDAHAEGGLTAVFDAYDRLRARYYGTWTYDFSETALVAVAGRLAGGGRFEDAAALLDRNLDLFPGSIVTLATKAQMYERAGELERAKAAYRACLEADPEMDWCTRQLQRLGGS